MRYGKVLSKHIIGIKFILLKRDVIQNLRKIFSKYQIFVQNILSYDYVQNFKKPTADNIFDLADKLINESEIPDLLKKRYSSFDSGNGKKYEEGKLSLEDLYNLSKGKKSYKLISGKQELLENIIFNHIR